MLREVVLLNAVHAAGKQKTVGHVYFPAATKLPAFRSGDPKGGKPTAHGPVTLSNTKESTLTDTFWRLQALITLM